MKRLLGLCLFGCISLFANDSFKVGEVVTKWKAIGANHTIQIEYIKDPDINGVTCYISRAKTGGISGSFGLAEDTSDASISCRQTGYIELPKKLIENPKLASEPQDVFQKSTSLIFKKMNVVRFWDKDNNSLVYLVYSDKVIDGSPQNSVSAISINNNGFVKPIK